MKSNSVFFYLLLIGTLCANFLLAGPIVKINDKEYSTADFQQYINFLKDNGGADTIKAMLADPDEKNGLLNQFIDQKVLLLTANKAGYNRKSEKIQKRWNDVKDAQMLQYFVTVQTAKNPISKPTEDEMKAIYKKVNPNPTRTYESLTDQEKQQLVQYVVMEKRQIETKNYYNTLEKKYKVVRSPLTEYFVGQVEGIKIKQVTLTEEVDKQLILAGRSKEEAMKQPQEYEKIRFSVRDGLIYQELLKLEIANAKFVTSPAGLFAQDYLQDDMVVQSYVGEEIISKIAISDAEINEEYARNKQALANKPFDQVHAYLKSAIQQKKFQKTLPNFLSEKREECVIKRDKSELEKIQ